MAGKDMWTLADRGRIDLTASRNWADDVLNRAAIEGHGHAQSSRLRCVDRSVAAGHPTQIAKRGAAYNYNDPEFRRREREFVEQQEHAYEVMVAHWQPTRPGNG